MEMNFFCILPVLVSFSGVGLSYIFDKNEFLSKRIVTISASISCVLACLAFILNFPKKTATLSFVTFHNLGISLLIDPLSLILLAMISILGIVIILFSRNYLEGDPRQLAFLRNVLMTVACAMTLVASGNLLILFFAWIGTSFLLHHLLLYCKNRPKSRIPARKKFILARLSDLFLFLGFWQLFNIFGTGDIHTIHNLVLSGKFSSGHIEIPALFLTIVCVLKCAQFPFTGWLIEVMESPTPVSALLHAGILNAGPVLILRFSGLFGSTHISPIILITIGGITAIYASAVLLTQSATKTILGYSSAAHMGFSLFLCGIGAYSAALLHLVGHSFYKAYAFLNSGSAIQDLQKSGKVTLSIKNPPIVVIGPVAKCQ